MVHNTYSLMIKNSMMRQLDVQDYYIQIGSIEESLPFLLQGLCPSKVFVLVDENTEKYCLPKIATLIPDAVPIKISAGEVHKTIDTCQQIWLQLIKGQADRDAVLLNLGGGVIGDMGGFCAGTYKRGIRFVQIPTTLLAQVDASVGGKLGVDFQSLKNIVGLFQNPQAVLIDPSFLDTLTDKELRSGFAEILKHALIQDANHWELVSKIRDLRTQAYNELIYHSVNIKKQVVLSDFHEKGLRKILNFGHTIGHAVEGVALGTNHHLLHGEAIAIGMITEAFLSHKLCGLPKNAMDNIKETLLSIYGKVPLDFVDMDKMMQLMSNDKKNKGASIKFALLKDIGTAVEEVAIEEPLILESLAYYHA